MMHLTYAIAFLTLLRFDEMLRIEFQHMKIVDYDSNHSCIKLTLSFRKTHQKEDKRCIRAR